MAGSRQKTILLLAIGVVAALLVVGTLRFTASQRQSVGEVFRASRAAVLRRAEALKARAASFDQEKALAALNPSRFNEFFIHLENVSPSAVSGPPRSATDARDPYFVNVDYQSASPDDNALLPERASSETSNGMLRLSGWRAMDRLSTDALPEIPVREIAQFELRMKVKRGSRLVLYTSTHPDALRQLPPYRQRRPRDAAYTRVSVPIIADGQFHLYRIDAANATKRRKAKQKRTLKRILLYPSDADTDDIEIDYFRVTTKRDQYAQAPFGKTHFGDFMEMHQGIYVNTPLTLDYTVDLPPGKPTLRLGMAVLLPDDPVQFAVSFRCGADVHAALSTKVADPDQWPADEVDLKRCAGKSTVIRLAATAANGNVGFWSNPTVDREPGRRLNIIVLLEDALRPDYLSCYGYPRKTTPAKDEWVKHGVLFEYAFAQAPKTRPSVPSLMTSLYPTATGVWGFTQFLSDAYLTLAEILRHQGFVTSSFIQNGSSGPFGGLHQGFSQVARIGNKTPAMYGKRLRQFLERHQTRNFFLFLHLIDPHGPYDPPSPFDDWYREQRPSEDAALTPNAHLEPKTIKQPTTQGRRLRYAGEVRHNDVHFAKLLTWLKQLNIYDHTLLVILADHGEHLGEHDLWAHKAPGYIQVLRVPLLIAHPNRIPSRVRIKQPVQLIDVMPTILDLAEVDTGQLALQGDSLLPLIEGRNPAYWNGRVAISEEVTDKKRVDVFGASLFFRQWHTLTSETTGFQVFDYVADSAETQPLRDPATIGVKKNEVAAFLATFQKTNHAIHQLLTADKKKTIRYDPRTVRRLKALGYMQ